ncbi:MAG: ATPase, partial [Planctomycetaceae bacterium]|nr:ATPase [Planctomycetaceae bacterium]
MIDGNEFESSTGSGKVPHSRSAFLGNTQPVGDLYADVFLTPETPSSLEPLEDPGATKPVSSEPSLSAEPVTAPPCPTTLEAAGIGLMPLADLLLKHLYLQGNTLGVQLARQVRLPFQLVEEALRLLKAEKCLEVLSGDLIGPASYRFNLTEIGRQRAQECFQNCRYVGPAPVSLKAYVDQCRKQQVSLVSCRVEALRTAFEDFVIRPGLLEELGPAVCSGQSIFVHGPPGNGKTIIGKGLGQFLNEHGGEIYVPYAVEAEGSIITIFDPTVHKATDQEELAGEQSPLSALSGGADGEHPNTDLRWRRVKRPVVITGGELTLEMLDLRYHKESNFYNAPLHIKANGGVFLIDDFGRQIVSPRELLNRWILPLEDRVDYLTLVTGKKLAVPFEQLIVFSTNLDPRELVDEAFLRRIRHKIRIGPPSRELYSEIFQLCCKQRKIPYDAGAVEYLFA